MDYRPVARLTRLIVEFPQMTKKDDKATRAAEDQFGAHDSGHYRKMLYPKHLVDPIQSVASAARAYMYTQTRPHILSGQYLLPHRRLMAYLDQMGKYELQFWQSVTAFLNNWSNVMVAAASQQGGLFDPSEYPDTTVLKEQFVFEYPLSAPPAADDDTVMDELTDDAYSIVTAKIQKDQDTAAAAEIKAAFVDLKKEVARIAKQTSVVTYTNAKGEVSEKSGKIYDSLTGDIENLVDILRGIGCGGSEELLQIVEDVDLHLTMPPAILRSDLEVCRITKAKADDILKQMEAFL